MPPVFSHTTTRWKRLWSLFGVWKDPDIDVGAHLIRLIVLYEDMRIEFHAFYAPELNDLDQLDVIYRRLYFLRRIYVTLVEIGNAIHQLNSSKEFRQLVARLGEDRPETWGAAVSFFSTNHQQIKTRRNLYGGHFSDNAARYAREHLDSETIGAIAIRADPHQSVSRVVYKFALVFVGLALTSDREGADVQEFVEEGFEFVRLAMRHATGAINALGEGHVLPYYGFTWS